MADESKESNSILDTARSRFKLGQDALTKTHQLAKEDLDFKAGIQWDEKMRKARESTDRPCLTINRIPQFVRQITNDQRQNRPSIRVLPAGNGAKEEVAKIYQGIIRHIEYQSNAESAYDHAFEGAVDKGFGFFRIVTEYESPKSFNQVARIKRIPDHFSVIIDPFSREPDGSDANWAFIYEDIQKDVFESKYKDADLCSADRWTLAIEQYPDWVKEDSIRICEYFYKDFKDDTLISWISNSPEIQEGVSLKSEFEDLIKTYPGIKFEEIDRRPTTTAVVKWVKFAGDETLDETEFPSQYIPIIPVYGTESRIEDSRVFEGIIRHAKDPQRAYNFWVTSETETIALAPKAPYVAAVGQIENLEQYWETANSQPHSVLPYNPIDIQGTPLPPPQRNAYEPPVQAITNARLQSAEDMKATTGIYDAALGQRSNEQSGIAIQRRANQAQTANFHFVDNLNLSIKHAGRILLEVIPVVYDLPRSQQIIGEDGQAEIIYINQPYEKDGKEYNYDLSVGKYDVVVEAGPGYATKRQEAAAAMLEISASNPQIMGIAGDLFVKNMDWPGAQEIAERLRKTIPQHILGEDNQQIPPQAQAQMTQMNQMIQQLQGALQQATLKLETKQLELASKERIEFAKMDVDLQKEAMKIPTPGAFENLVQQMAEINQRLQLVGINQPMVTQMPTQNIQPDFTGAGLEQGQPPLIQQPTSGQLGSTMGVQP